MLVLIDLSDDSTRGNNGNYDDNILAALAKKYTNKNDIDDDCIDSISNSTTSNDDCDVTIRLLYQKWCGDNRSVMVKLHPAQLLQKLSPFQQRDST